MQIFTPFLCLVTIVQFACSCDQTFYTNENGTDHEGCLEEGGCLTLDYVLTNLDLLIDSNGMYYDDCVCIVITYSQDVLVDEFNLTYAKYQNLTLTGVGNPTLNFHRTNVSQQILFSGHIETGYTFYIEGITIINVNRIKFDTFYILKFKDCTIAHCSRFEFHSMFQMAFYTCLVEHNRGSVNNRELIFVADNINKFYIIDSIFVYNTYNDGTIINKIPSSFVYGIYSPVMVLIDNSTFSSNNASIFKSERLSKSNEITYITILFFDSTFTNNTSTLPHIVKLEIGSLHNFDYTNDVTLAKNVLFGRVSFQNLVFSNNTASSSKEDFNSAAILKLENAVDNNHALGARQRNNINMENLTFSSNLATALSIKKVYVTLSPPMYFFNNHGVYGGAIQSIGSIFKTYLFENQTIGPIMIFEQNTAELGGALYSRGEPYCSYIFIQDKYNGPANKSYFQAIDNYALSTGNDVFIYNPNCGQFVEETIDFSTGPNYINFTNSKMELFFGQKIHHTAIVTDYKGHFESCLSQVNPVYSDNSGSVELMGGTETLLTSGYTVTDMYFSSINSSLQNVSISLVFACFNLDTFGSIDITISPCPFGYEFKHDLGICECIHAKEMNCDNGLGFACIKHNYWIGEIKTKDFDDDKTNVEIHNCQYPFCTRNLKPCPIQGLHDTHFELPSQQDDQCNGLNGGLLCRGCREGAVFTFEAVKCIPVSHCHEWHPYIVILCAIAFQLLLSFLIIASLKTRYKTGIGHIYGPVFFLSLMKILPFGSDKSLYNLKIVLSLFQSIALLNLEVIGEIPWCFFQECNHLLNYSIRLAAPLIVIVPLLINLRITKRFLPRQYSRLQFSALELVAFLFFICYWSVSNTSINLLTPHISKILGWRVSVSLDAVYLRDPIHIVGFVFAVLILGFICLPLVVLITFAPIIQKRFRMYHIQPLLDSFHSAYKRPFRWYSGVYFIAWIVLNCDLPYLATKVTIFAVSLMHFMIQPYHYQWLNAIDTFLLIIACLICSLLPGDMATTTLKLEEIIVIYIVVIVVIIYIVVGGCVMIFKTQLLILRNKMTEAMSSKRRNSIQHELHSDILDSGDIDILSRSTPTVTVLDINSNTSDT